MRRSVSARAAPHTPLRVRACVTLCRIVLALLSAPFGSLVLLHAMPRRGQVHRGGELL